MSRGTDEMLLPFGVKLLLVTLQQVGAWGARDQGTGQGTRGLGRRFCVTLFKEHSVRDCEEQRYFRFYSLLAPFITRTLLVCPSS